MLRRCTLSFILLVIVAGPAAAAERPNVVLIISDDQAWTDYSFMGHEQIDTPALDRLAAESLTFTRGYVPTALCRSSLATMINGLYPHQHGITGNDPTLPDPVNAMASRRNPKYARYYETLMARIEQHPTLPRTLGPLGYLSLQTGKWWEGRPSRGGFTHGMTHGDPQRGGRHGDVGLKIGREGLAPVFDFIARARRQDRPFLLWYAPFLPHAPHTPPQDLLEKYRSKAPTDAVARYWAMCELFDRTCGALLDHLAANDLAKDTIVIYVCDNGWIQDPQRPNRFAPRSKLTSNEGGIRTPIMVRWPGHVEPRFDKTTLASSIDIAPTVLTACGLEPTAAMPGVNLLDAAAMARRTTLFGETYHHNIADVDRPTRSLRCRWIIDGRWKLILPTAAAKPNDILALYDVTADPHERNNLAAEEPDRVANLTTKLDAWWQPPAD